MAGVDGVVLSHRAAEAFPLDWWEKGIDHITVGCCGDCRMDRTLAELDDIDVIVADWQSWDVARNDGRPYVLIGFAHRADEGLMWDLDEKPLHPWGATPPARNRGLLRRELGLERDQIIVMTMSSRGLPGSVEAFCSDALDKRLDVQHVVAESPRWFAAADLVIVNAGWAAFHEARWSGAPMVAVAFPQGADQPLRAIGNAAKAVELVRLTRVQPVPPRIPDHVPEFVVMLKRIVDF